MAWTETADPLPSSHVFVTISRVRNHRTFALPRSAVWCVAAATIAALVWSVGCTLYVTCHDQFVTSLIARQRDAQYAYEDQIAALQRDLDRATSSVLLAHRSSDARLDELTTQAKALRQRAASLESLAGQFAHLAAARPLPSQAAAVGSELPDQAPAVGPGSLPAPVGEVSRKQSSVIDRTTRLSAELTDLAQDQANRVAALGQVADARVKQDQRVFDEAGLQANRFAKSLLPAIGGPFIPLPTSGVSGLDSDLQRLTTSLERAVQLDAVVAQIPLKKPLDGSPAITSTFGPRIDPFNGRPALHAGIDLREDTGTAVLATAPGRITVAGPASGYGTMVEIDHGFGLATRYAHLSETSVGVGETVDAGTIVGRVGATGRATGPHLHYETRIDGEPVDPMRFLTAGETLLLHRGEL